MFLEILGAVTILDYVFGDTKPQPTHKQSVSTPQRKRDEAMEFVTTSIHLLQDVYGLSSATATEEFMNARQQSCAEYCTRFVDGFRYTNKEHIWEICNRMK